MIRHFITKIKINEVRHLKNVEIDLSSNSVKHLLLTGKNGSGKTTVLEAIKSYLKSIEDGNIKYRDSLWNNHIYNYSIELNNLQDLQEQVARKNELITTIDNFKAQIKRYGNGLDVKFSEAMDLHNLYKSSRFILAYYGANRQTKVNVVRAVEKVDLKDSYSLDENPSEIFVKYLVDLKTQQSFARNEGDMEVVDSIEYWFNNLQNALKTIFADNTIELKFDYKNYDFKIKQQGRDNYGLNELSDGYSSVINIVSDIILRMEKCKTNENEKRNYIYDVEGIVLIDEVETHLHIELQKSILPFLTGLFPRLQFIITTHSPFVLGSVSNAIIYDLENKIKVEDLSKYSYEGIVEGYFNVDKYSSEVKNKIEEYERLVNKTDLTDDERARRAELKIELKEISSNLAIELKLKFEEIEMKRKSSNDKDK